VIEEDATHLWAQAIGGRIRDTRKRLGLSLEDLSRLSGSTVSTLSHIERGTRDVKLSTLVSLAAALRIDLSALFVEGDRDNRRTPPTEVCGYSLDDD
jgi:transcriptional regulator with XRE-family HTH domain